MRQDHIHLILFLTGGNSLRTWDTVGTLNRELALYQNLIKKGWKVTLVSYGGPRELHYRAQLKGINLICNAFRLPQGLYIFWLTKILPRFWKGKVLIKCNQIRGGEVALEAAKTAGVKFIARCGYLASQNAREHNGPDSEKEIRMTKIERLVFQGANRVIVTTEQLKEKIIHKYATQKEKFSCIPNFVDTDLFAPKGVQKDIDVLFIGTLGGHKNIFNLVEAFRGSVYTLSLIGDGKDEEKLKMKVRNENLPVRFLGRMAHEQIPEYLNRARIYILPSLIEGHPKTLIEAMACGCAVIGTNVIGINNLIQDRKTGLLCGTSADEIKDLVTELMKNELLQATLAKNAREYAIEHFSIKTILDQELQLYQEVLV